MIMLERMMTIIMRIMLIVIGMMTIFMRMMTIIMRMIFCRDLTTAQGLVPTGIDGDDDKMIIQREDFCC